MGWSSWLKKSFLTAFSASFSFVPGCGWCLKGRGQRPSPALCSAGLHWCKPTSSTTLCPRHFPSTAFSGAFGFKISSVVRRNAMKTCLCFPVPGSCCPSMRCGSSRCPLHYSPQQLPSPAKEICSAHCQRLPKCGLRRLMALLLACSVRASLKGIYGLS